MFNHRSLGPWTTGLVTWYHDFISTSFLSLCAYRKRSRSSSASSAAASPEERVQPRCLSPPPIKSYRRASLSSHSSGMESDEDVKDANGAAIKEPQPGGAPSVSRWDIFMNILVCTTAWCSHCRLSLSSCLWGDLDIYFIMLEIICTFCGIYCILFNSYNLWLFSHTTYSDFIPIFFGDWIIVFLSFCYFSFAFPFHYLFICSCCISE